MSDPRPLDSSPSATEDSRWSQPYRDSKDEPEQLSDSKEPLLPESENSLEERLYKRQKPARRSRAWICILTLLAFLCLALAGTVAYLAILLKLRVGEERRWNVQNFKSFLAFGDSYTDELRYAYFAGHDNNPPPAGTLFGENLDNGRTWARYVVQYTGSSSEEDGQWNPQMTLYNYALAGSFCSGEIVPREHPTMLEYAVPAFAADKAANRINTTEPYFQPPLTPSNAVFAVWTGTNDLGMFSFLTDDQARGKVIGDFTDCVYRSMDGLYAAGARTFVLMNTIPLQLAPSMANETLHGEGEGDNNWRAEKIHELTTAVNDIFQYQTPYEFAVSNRYPDAQIALFDVWTLFREIYFHPEVYLNGTAPANVTSYVRHDEVSRASPDSYLWLDAIHPSEQTNRILAKNFVEVLNGTSKYAQYW